MLGHGSKNQIKNVKKVDKIIRDIVYELPKKSVFLYFGDVVNEKKPDIGYVFSVLAKYGKKNNKNIKIVMIQIDGAKEWGTPDFVNNVYWHKQWIDGEYKWGGVKPIPDKKGEPQSNTKVWFDLMNNIKKIYVLGGGPITKDEVFLAQNNGVDIEYKQLERKYKGDGITNVLSTDNSEDMYGIMHEYFGNN